MIEVVLVTVKLRSPAQYNIFDHDFCRTIASRYLIYIDILKVMID